MLLPPSSDITAFVLHGYSGGFMDIINDHYQLNDAGILQLALNQFLFTYN